MDSVIKLIYIPYTPKQKTIELIQSFFNGKKRKTIKLDISPAGMHTEFAHLRVFSTPCLTAQVLCIESSKLLSQHFFCMSDKFCELQDCKNHV